MEIRNMETGVASSLLSDSSGHFREPVLQPGAYDIRVLAKGFQTSVRTGLHLAVGQEAVLDIALQLGSAAGEVTVTAAPSRIDIVTGSRADLSTISRFAIFLSTDARFSNSLSCSLA